jgi:alkylation response protein AidB-like acyl-CoA dehydrogenase
MRNLLTAEQSAERKRFHAFAADAIRPRAAEADARQAVSRDVVKALAAEGLLSAMVPGPGGDPALDPLEYGLLTEEIGWACQNVRNFVAVSDMVAHSVWRWGTDAQRDRWLGPIAAGEKTAAFALTEPGIGSDAKNIATTAEQAGNEIVLRGRKKWISFGAIADVFLVFAQYDGKHTAFLVEREAPGLDISPIVDLLGLRGSLLAELTFTDCRIPAANLVGRPGTGLTFVASSALDVGRYSTAWGSVGLARACAEDSAAYATRRSQGGGPIRDHQLIQAMLTDMHVNSTAARLLCHRAGLARAARDPEAINQTLVAKYFASTAAMRAAADAVQIHGAVGIGSEVPVQRYLRDAKVMEIIEGTSQLLQSILGAAATGAGL